MRMTSAITSSAIGAAVLTGCTPPRPVPVELAEAQCVQQVLSGTTGNSSVTFGVGTGYGGWGWDGPGYGGWGGSGVAISTTVPTASQSNPAQQYNDCVIRRSGQPPVTPFAKRPELKG